MTEVYRAKIGINKDRVKEGSKWFLVKKLTKNVRLVPAIGDTDQVPAGPETVISRELFDVCFERITEGQAKKSFGTYRAIKDVSAPNAHITENSRWIVTSKAKGKVSLARCSRYGKIVGDLPEISVSRKLFEEVFE